MARRVYNGAAKATTTVGAINATDLTVVIADATNWPSGANEFFVTFERGGAGEERALATRTGTTLTFASTAKRGVDNTTAVSHASGVAIEHTFSGVDADEANDHTSGTGTVHAGQTVSPAALIIPGATVPAQTAEGSAVWDTDNDLLTVGTGSARKTLVDTDTAQTLAGKTFTAPTVGDFTNANHTHGSAAQGGGLSFPAVRAYRTTAQSVPGTLTALTWNLESFDTDGFHSTSSNTERLTVPAGLGGLYAITVGATFNAATASGAAILEIRLNGLASAIIGFAEEYYTSAQDVTLMISTFYRLVAGDFIDSVILHGQAGSLNVNGAGSNFQYPAFEMVRLGA